MRKPSPRGMRARYLPILDCLEKRLVLSSDPISLPSFDWNGTEPIDLIRLPHVDWTETEPNDTLATANEIELHPLFWRVLTALPIAEGRPFDWLGDRQNGYVSGELAPGDVADVDYFTFTAGAHQTIAVSLSGSAVDGGAALTLLDADGNVLATAAVVQSHWGLPNPAELTYDSDTGGLFYIRVAAADESPVEGEYYVSVTTANAPISEQEPNDSLADATPIALEPDEWDGDRQHGYVTGAFAAADDVDVFSITTEAERRITITIQTHGSDWNVTPELLDAAGNVLPATIRSPDFFIAGAVANHAIIDRGGYVEVDYFTPTGGDFFLRLTAEPSGKDTSASYLVNVATAPDPYLEREPNDTLATATPIAMEDYGEGESTGFAYGTVQAPDEDFFSFDVNPGSTIYLDAYGAFQHHGGQVALLDAAGNVLAEDVDGDDGLYVEWNTLEGGTFFVHVSQGEHGEEPVPTFAPDGSEDGGGYSLSLCVGETPNPIEGYGEHEPNDSLETANVIELYGDEWSYGWGPGTLVRYGSAEGIAGGETGDRDFFQFDVAAGETIRIYVGVEVDFYWENSDSQVPLAVVLCDAEGNRLARANADGDQITYESIDGGTYFLKVQVPSGAETTELFTYYLSVEAETVTSEGWDETEPNDSFETANPIDLVDVSETRAWLAVRGGEVMGLAGGPEDDHDYFQFDVVAGESVHVSVQGLVYADGEVYDWADWSVECPDEGAGDGGMNDVGDVVDDEPYFFQDVVLVVYDADGNEIGRSRPNGDYLAHEVAFEAPADGTYYAVVSVPSSANHDYSTNYHLGIVAQTALGDDGGVGIMPILTYAPGRTPAVITIGVDETFEFTDSDGDLVKVKFGGKAGTVTLTFTGVVADGSDLAAIVVDGARKGDLRIKTDGATDVAYVELNGRGKFQRLAVDGDLGRLVSALNLKKVNVEGMLGTIAASDRKIERLNVGLVDLALLEVERIERLEQTEKHADAVFAILLGAD